MPTTFQDVSVFGFHSSPSFTTLDRQTFRSLFHFAKKTIKKIFLPLKTSSLPISSYHHVYMFLPLCIISFVFLYFGLLERKRDEFIAFRWYREGRGREIDEYEVGETNDRR